MGFESCRICKKPFNREKGDLCQACAEIESINIKKITDYLQAFEKSNSKTFSVKSLSAATGVKIQDIERLYKYNKLRGYAGLIDMDCKICGDKFKPTIHSGVLCKCCTGKVEKIVKELKESALITEHCPSEEKVEEILKSKKEEKEEKEAVKTSGMHVKDDSRQRFGFKKH